MEPAQRPRTTDQERHEAEALVCILGAIAHRVDAEFDPVAADRLAWRALHAVSGPLPEQAAKRLTFMARNLGIRLAFRRRPLQEALNEVKRGAPVVFAGNPVDRDPWFLAAGRSGKKYKILGLVSERTAVWIEGHDLVGLLNPGGGKDVLCAVPVILNPCDGWGEEEVPHAGPKDGTKLGHGGHKHDSDEPHARLHHHMPPQLRLWRILAPEGWDILLILGFATTAGVLMLSTPIAVESLVNFVAFGTVTQPIFVLSAVLFAFLTLGVMLRLLQTYVVELMQRRFFLRLAVDLSVRLPRIRFRHLEETDAPELVNRFFDVMTVQKATATFLLDGLTLFLQITIGLAVLAFYHPYLLGFDAILVACCVFIIFGLGRGGTATAIDESMAKHALVGRLEELVRCPLAFKTPFAAEYAAERTETLARTYLDSRQKHFRVLFRQILAAGALQVAANVALLGLGGWLVVQGELTLGQLVAGELLVSLVVSGFAKSGKHFETYYDLMAAVDKIGHLVDVPLERESGEGTSGVGPMRVAFKDLTFRIGNRTLFSHLDLEVEAGAKLVVRGPSGVGKSVLADLLYGLRPLQHGSVLLDGVHLSDWQLPLLRDQVSLVRGPEILDGTVLDNVRVGRHELDLQGVHHVLEAVGLLDVILDLPLGLHTPLSPHGRPLSEGQILQLMLARAMLGRPRLLVLDRVLDGLPPETREATLDMLFRPDAPWTLVVITGSEEIAARGDRNLDLTPPSPTPLPAAPKTALPGGGPRGTPRVPFVPVVLPAGDRRP